MLLDCISDVTRYSHFLRYYQIQQQIPVGSEESLLRILVRSHFLKMVPLSLLIDLDLISIQDIEIMANGINTSMV